MGKITVKHILNKTLKPVDGNKFPVYLTIWFRNKLTRTKSYWWTFLEGDGVKTSADKYSYLTQRDFDNLEKDEKSYFTALTDESNAVENIVRLFHEKYNKNILSTSPVGIIKSALEKPSHIVSDYFKDKLKTDFAKSEDSKFISAQLMIKWKDFSFINIYDGLFSICNDGKTSTQFYRDVLSSYTSDYKGLKILYDFVDKRNVRFWNWMENPEGFENALSQHLEKSGLIETSPFINACNAQFTAQKNTLLNKS